MKFVVRSKSKLGIFDVIVTECFDVMLDNSLVKKPYVIYKLKFKGTRFSKCVRDDYKLEQTIRESADKLIEGWSLQEWTPRTASKGKR